MFASLVLEQEPLRWLNFPSAGETWVRIMGAFSAAVLLVWLIVSWLRSPGGRRRNGISFMLGSSSAIKRYYADVRPSEVKWPAAQAILFRWLILGAFAGYLLWG